MFEMQALMLLHERLGRVRKKTRLIPKMASVFSCRVPPTRASKSIDHKSAPEELAQGEGYRTGA